MSNYQIYITAKQGIFNPAGATSAKALEQLGYSGVSSVRVGKFIELTTDDKTDEAAVREMCEKLLANPIIEDFRIETVGGLGDTSGSGNGGASANSANSANSDGVRA